MHNLDSAIRSPYNRSHEARSSQIVTRKTYCRHGLDLLGFPFVHHHSTHWIFLHDLTSEVYGVNPRPAPAQFKSGSSHGCSLALLLETAVYNEKATSSLVVSDNDGIRRVVLYGDPFDLCNFAWSNSNVSHYLHRYHTVACRPRGPFIISAKRLGDTLPPETIATTGFSGW